MMSNLLVHDVHYILLQYTNIHGCDIHDWLTIYNELKNYVYCKFRRLLKDTVCRRQ